MSSKKSNLVLDLNKPHVCEFCNNRFARESTLVSHQCEPRRRHMVQHEPHVKLALHAYKIWWQHLNPHKTVPVTYQQFSGSQLYGVFVRIGSWALEQQVQEFASWIEWNLKAQTPVDRWCDVNTYQSYIKDLLLNEPHLQAMQRSLATLVSWGEISDKPWNQFFKLAHVNLIINWIQQGRISAWMLYNSDTALVFLEKCSQEQLQLVQQAAPHNLWKIRFMRMQPEANAVRAALTEAGL